MGFSITAFAAGLQEEPFFWFRVGPTQVKELQHELMACAARPREWFTLAATHENPSRLRLKHDITPQFEVDAAPVYVRGDSLRITGAAGRSCNITFSSVGAAELARRLEEAQRQMQEFLELRIPSRRHPLIELIPDTQLATREQPDPLAAAFESEAAEALGQEDFSDWES